jgi:hypothetical protein
LAAQAGQAARGASGEQVGRAAPEELAAQAGQAARAELAAQAGQAAAGKRPIVRLRVQRAGPAAGDLREGPA